MIKTEYSSGGVIVHKNTLCLICVKNFKGMRVWTFPKGHIEHGETARETAVREVEEETGYKCKIIRPLIKVQYYFTERGQVICKRVQWYLMKKLIKRGKPDLNEIEEVRWVSFEKAQEMIQYASDKRLIKLAGAFVNMNSHLFMDYHSR